MNQEPRPPYYPPSQQYPPTQQPTYINQAPPPYPPQQPPNTFYPPQQQPPMYRPPMPPPKKTTLSPRTILIIVIACVIVGGIGAVSNFFNAAKKAAATPTAQVQQAAQTTTAPTKAPTPTPTVVLSIEGRVNKILEEQKADMKSSSYISDTKSVVGTKYIGFQLNTDSYRDSIKMDCFRLQKALWTANPSLELTSVTVFLQGDVVDTVGNESIEQVGACTLKQAKADNFNWSGLTWATAWGNYDSQYVAPFLQ